MKLIPLFGLLGSFLFSEFSLNAQELNLFYLWPYEKETKEIVFFTSLSDIYPYDEEADFSLIPSIDETEDPKNRETIYLDGTYRSNFLAGAGISATDFVYVFDYSVNRLKTFRVKDLKLIACLNLYGADWPYHDYDYHIGFAFELEDLAVFKKEFSTILIHVGKENPFFNGKLTQLAWKEIEEALFPAALIESKNTAYFPENAYTVGQNYQFETSEFTYYLQNLIGDYWGENTVFARRLIIVNQNTGAKILEKVYYESEGISLATLEYQWTGKLFKQKPAVIFGFEWSSFGCDRISFLDFHFEDLYTKCDNRH